MNFANKRTVHNVLSLGYYCPSIFHDVKKYVRSCGNLQRIGQPIWSNEMPLLPQPIIKPFERWDLYFVRPINPPSKQNVYILMCINYVTKWVEAKDLQRPT